MLGLPVGLIVLAAVAVAWFGEVGGGESRDSPDGRWRATAMKVSYGTWLEGRAKAIKIEVVDNQTGRAVWCVRRTPFPGEAVPELRDRSMRVVSWDTGSTVATFDLGQMGVVQLPTP